MIVTIFPSNHNSQSRKMNFAMYCIVADIRRSRYFVVLSLETTVERFVIKPSQHDMDKVGEDCGRAELVRKGKGMSGGSGRMVVRDPWRRQGVTWGGGPCTTWKLEGG